MWAAVVGGSMGGMRAIEWAVSYPDRVRCALVLACGAQASGEQIALCSVQAHAIRADPRWRGGDYYDAPPGEGPHVGLGVARRSARSRTARSPSWRCASGAPRRTARTPSPTGATPSSRTSTTTPSASPAASTPTPTSCCHAPWTTTTSAAAAAGWRRRSSASRAQVVVAGIDSDRLYPLYLQEQIAELLPGRPKLRMVASIYGHDAFLVEAEAVGRIIREALA